MCRVLLCLDRNAMWWDPYDPYVAVSVAWPLCTTVGSVAPLKSAAAIVQGPVVELLLFSCSEEALLSWYSKHTVLHFVVVPPASTACRSMTPTVLFLQSPSTPPLLAGGVRGVFSRA